MRSIYRVVIIYIYIGNRKIIRTLKAYRVPTLEVNKLGSNI
jgi:hypothetical protein